MWNVSLRRRSSRLQPVWRAWPPSESGLNWKPSAWRRRDGRGDDCTEEGEYRSESLLGDFSISETWIGSRPGTGCVSADRHDSSGGGLHPAWTARCHWALSVGDSDPPRIC